MQLHKSTSQISLWVLDIDFNGLSRQKTDKELFLLLFYIPLSRHQVDHCQKTELNHFMFTSHFMFLCFLLQSGTSGRQELCFPKDKAQGKVLPQGDRLAPKSLAQGYFIVQSWASLFTSFLNTHPTHKTQQQWVCWGCVKHLLSPHCPPQPAHSPDGGHQQAHESFSCYSFIVGNCQLLVGRAKI